MDNRKSILTRAPSRFFLLIVVIAAVGAWLRFAGLAEPGFWCDEDAYLYLDTGPPSTQHAHTHGFDLYVRWYAKMVHLFGASISDEFTFRCLPAALGTLAVVIMAGAGAACGARGIGLCAALLFAVHPYAVMASRVATQYGSLLFFVTVLIAAAVLVVKNGTWRTWGLLVVSSGFVYHLHILATCHVVGTWLAVMLCGAMRYRGDGRGMRQFVGKMCVAGLALIVLCLPEFINYTLPMLRGTSVGNLRASQRTLWQAIKWSVVAETLLSPHAWQRYVLYALMILGAGYALWRSPVILVSTILTVIITIVILKTMRLEQAIGVPARYLSFFVPQVLLLVAMGVWTIGAAVIVLEARMMGWKGRCVRVMRWASVAVMALLFSTVQAGEIVYRRAYWPLTEWREMGAFLNAVVRPGDAVLAGYDDQLLRRYYTNGAAPVIRLTGAYDARDVTEETIKEYMRRYERVWCVFVSGFVRWSGSPLPGWLDRTCIPLPFWSYGAAMHYWSRAEADGWKEAWRRDEKERELVEKVVRVAPRLYRAVRRMMELRMAAGEHQEGYRYLGNMLKQNPMDPRVHYELARCHMRGTTGRTNLVAAQMHLWMMGWCGRILPGTVEDLCGQRVAAEMELAVQAGHHARWKRLHRRAQHLLPSLSAEGRAAVLAALERCENLHARQQAKHSKETQNTGWRAESWGTNLVAADFEKWKKWSAGGPALGETAITHTEVDGRTQSVVRIANTATHYFGLLDRVYMESGGVYRMSGMARYAGPPPAQVFYGRLACYLHGQAEQDIVWPEAVSEWTRRTCIFTNMVNGVATIFVHLGYGNVITTAEFADIRVERANNE